MPRAPEWTLPGCGPRPGGQRPFHHDLRCMKVVHNLRSIVR